MAISKQKIALISGVTTALLFAIAGFLLVTHDSGMGYTLFFILPVSSGFAAIQAADAKLSAKLATALFVLSGLIGLIALKLEGWVCCLMVLPLVLPGVFLGALISGLARRIYNRPSGKALGILLAAGLVLGANWVEGGYEVPVRFESVASTVSIAATAAEVWNTIKAVDQVHVPKPFLLRIGLPVPVECLLQQEGLGGKRVCRFKKGEIEERITEWDPPRRMGLQIMRVTVPGRHWLKLQDAWYELEEHGGRTQITRVTRYRSELRPRWYWKPLEAMGVESEHDYILREAVWRIRRK